MLLVGPVEERLTDRQGPGVGLGAQPVAGVLVLGDDELEGAVGLDVHLLLVQGRPGARAAAAEAGAGEEVEADPLGFAPRPPDPVVVRPVEAGPEVVVVGVLADDLDGLVTGADEHGLFGAPVLEDALQPTPQQAGQHAEALGPVQGILGVALLQDGLPGVGEEVTELPPRRAVDDLLGGLVHHRRPRSRSHGIRRRGRRPGSRGRSPTGRGSGCPPCEAAGRRRRRPRRWRRGSARTGRAPPGAPCGGRDPRPGVDPASSQARLQPAAVLISSSGRPMSQ